MSGFRQNKINEAISVLNRPVINYRKELMYHCHILELHPAGMMAKYDVFDGSKPYVEKRATHEHHDAIYSHHH